jgi:hypothetical protein
MECFPNSGEEPAFVCNMLPVELQENSEGAIYVGARSVGQDLLHQVPRAFADFPAHGIGCQRRMGKGIPDMIDGIGQIFQGVDQGAVKVK